MSEIPADVMEQARAACPQFHEHMRLDMAHDWATQAIARAIMAERERCTKIANGAREVVLNHKPADRTCRIFKKGFESALLSAASSVDVLVAGPIERGDKPNAA